LSNSSCSGICFIGGAVTIEEALNSFDRAFSNEERKYLYLAEIKLVEG
jgi:hypothetical protein